MKKTNTAKWVSRSLSARIMGACSMASSRRRTRQLVLGSGVWRMVSPGRGDRAWAGPGDDVMKGSVGGNKF